MGKKEIKVLTGEDLFLVSSMIFLLLGSWGKRAKKKRSLRTWILAISKGSFVHSPRYFNEYYKSKMKKDIGVLILAMDNE